MKNHLECVYLAMVSLLQQDNDPKRTCLLCGRYVECLDERQDMKNMVWPLKVLTSIRLNYFGIIWTEGSEKKTTD